MQEIVNKNGFGPGIKQDMMGDQEQKMSGR